MKKIRLLGIALVTFIIGITAVSAAPTYSVSVSKEKIEVGSSVSATLTVTNTAAWNIEIKGTGNTNGCSTVDADVTSDAKNTTKKFTITCKANSIGIINIAFSGKLVDASANKTNISTNKTITVVAATPKSTNNYLKTLNIEGYELSPEFDKDTLEYNVSLPFGTTKLVVSATKEDNTATLKGTGSYDLEVGLNNIVVTVVAQNGKERKYIINATVNELSPISVIVDGKEYFVVRKSEELSTPSGFVSKTITIGDEEIPAFYSEILKYTLVGLRNDIDEIKFFIYDESKKEFNIYNEISFNGISFLALPFPEILKGYKEKTIALNGINTNALIIDDNSDFIVLYGTNVENGNTGFYLYDKKENILQRYDDSMIKKLEKKNQDYFFVSAVFGGGLLISTILLIVLASRKPKKHPSKKDLNLIAEEIEP